MKRIQGIDSIRFICAIYVLFGHLGVPLPDAITHTTNPLLINILKLFGLTFNGPAAVIVFFVISGFCIHYPTLFKGKINLSQYYSRRLLRISIPAIIAVFIYKFAGVGLAPPQFGVFWSIVCEVIYYILYPAILYLKKQFKTSWVPVIGIAYLVAFGLLFINKETVLAFHSGYPALGLATWVIGLPCWLLGCWLAENFSRFNALSPVKMWLVRGGVVAIGLLLRIIKFHINSVYASNCYTLNVFALLACIWLAYEIAYYQHRKPLRLLEWMGQWSYSIYIIHPVIYPLLAMAGIGAYLNNFLELVACLVASYVFYLSVERPSHKFALYFSKKVASKQMQQPVLVTEANKV